MIEIPADVVRAALKVVQEEAGFYLCAYGNVLVGDRTVEAIARAILAERERSALVADGVAFRAEKFERDRLNGPSIGFQRFREGACAAADAIRRGDQP